MSIGIIAQKRLTEQDAKLMAAWNTCCDAGIEPPTGLQGEIKKRIGLDLDPDIYPEYQPRAVNGIIEVEISALGRVMGRGGATFQIEDLPEGTFAVRVYAQD